MDRSDQPSFPPQHFPTKSILRTARKPIQKEREWWVGLKMDLKKNWLDFLSVNTFPPKPTILLLDLSVLFWINFSKDILSNVHTEDITFRRTERWWTNRTLPPQKTDCHHYNIQYLRACFLTACLPTAHYFGWRLGGVTFNLRLSGQFLCAVPKMHAVGWKNDTDCTQKKIFACGQLGGYSTLEWGQLNIHYVGSYYSNWIFFIVMFLRVPSIDSTCFSCT